MSQYQRGDDVVPIENASHYADNDHRQVRLSEAEGCANKGASDRRWYHSWSTAVGIRYIDPYLYMPCQHIHSEAVRVSCIHRNPDCVGERQGCFQNAGSISS